MLRVLLALLAFSQLALADDSARVALTVLCDPAKIATLGGDLTAAAMVRNRTIAERLGCLDSEGMQKLRRGASPSVKRGPYTGEKLTVDHIIPRAVTPSLDLVLANLELMPHSLNIRKGARIGQRQIDLANKLHAAGLLSETDRQRVISRQTAGLSDNY